MNDAEQKSFDQNRVALTAARPTWEEEMPALQNWLDSLKDGQQYVAFELAEYPGHLPEAVEKSLELWRLYDEAVAAKH